MKGLNLKSVELIRSSIQEGRKTLNEAVSKQLLSHYGLPVVPEAVAATPEDAVSQAEALGFPVVVKGLGSQLTHKTELGLVRIGLTSAESVRQAFQEIKDAGGQAWEGCLIQPMVAGRREFVAGLMRDAQFGPVVMFGLGGIFAEAIGDVVFRIAPVDRHQADQMIADLRTSRLLADFRGEAAADPSQLADILTGLSDLAMAHPQIKEVDINPLIVSADGSVTAVDALVVLNDDDNEMNPEPMDAAAEKERTRRINQALEAMTNPKSVAVVGVARTQLGGYPGIYRCIRNFGFPGRLYPINPNTDDIEGVKAYPSLTALPEKVDLVSLSVAAHRAPEALRDCVASGNKNVHMFTSGFKESGEAEGIRLHEEIEKIATEGGLNIVGPNCMGLHVPKSRLLTWIKASEISGPVAMVSQSGGNAQDFVNIGNRMGLYFSKVISYGNALNLDSTDYLAYLAEDDDTEIIAMYLEGVKNGRRLVRLITEINRTKPVVMVKGGWSESGARTVASHTGALAGGEKIWRAFFRQTGAVQAATLQEMADIVLAFRHLPPVRGRNVAILGTGGGIGVAAADSCSQAGLSMPALSEAAMLKLREYIPPAGNMIRNPIDAHILLLKLELMGPTLQLLSAQPDLDMFIFSLHLDWLYGYQQGRQIDQIAHFLVEEGHKHTNGKPIAVVWRQFQPGEERDAARHRLEQILHDGGIAVYEGLDRALKALSKVADYYEFQGQQNRK